MGNGHVDYASLSEDTTRGLSPGLWKGSHYDEIVGGRSIIGKHWGDHFQSTPVTSDAYTLYESDGNASIGPVLAGDDGGIILAVSGTNNQEANIAFTVDSSIIDDIDTDSGFELYFEARWKVSSVTDDYIAVYVGLGEAALKGSAMQTDDSAVLAVKDFLVHRTEHRDSGTAGKNAVLDAVFATASGAEVDFVAAQATLVGNTFIKTGFKFDGRTKVQSFVNGLASPTTVSPAATNFPNTEKLTFVCGMILGDGAAADLELAWWECVVHKPSARS